MKELFEQLKDIITTHDELRQIKEKPQAQILEFKNDKLSKILLQTNDSDA